MRALFIISILFSITSAKAQITPTKLVWAEDFEYTTDCNEAIPGTIYHLPPQLHNPHTGSRHLYLNFVNDLSAMTVVYEKQTRLSSEKDEFLEERAKIM